MNFENIPHEMREYDQWLLWRADETVDGKSTKVPYQSKRPNELASVTNAAHWSTYTEAVAASGWASGIGFVFTRECPYTGIDLDPTTDVAAFKKQLEIYKKLQTYTEKSPSGLGLHMIARGKVDKGVRFKFIEMYPHGRFFTMTGDIYELARPIADRQFELTKLYEEMTMLRNNVPVAYQGDAPETATDREIWEMAAGAENGPKFQSLWLGDWKNTINERTKQPYPSQSEADLALMDILAFYTQNAEQLYRLFRASELGKRAKASRADYIGWLISKSFDRLSPPINIDLTIEKLDDQISGGVREKLANVGKPKVAPSLASDPYAVPPLGLVGMIAEWCHRASPRPVPQIALAAALGLMAGICGRAYNVSNTGLNIYLILIAETGTGKDAMATTTNRLIQEVYKTVKSIDNYRGPAEIASGQGLLRFLADRPSFFAIINEFGYKLQQLASDRANSADLLLKRLWLDLYGKSGAGQTLQPMVYSDTQKNTPEIYSPSVTILGEGTPGSIYENMTERMIKNGLLTRCIMVDYSGPRPPPNKDAYNVPVPGKLLDGLAELVVTSNTLQQEGSPCVVEMTQEAKSYADEFNLFCDDNWNNAPEGDVKKDIWTRAYLNVLKLAALVAVGIDYKTPIINLETVKWARGIVEHAVRALIQRFEAGDIGSAADVYGRNEMAQVKAVAIIILKYLNSNYEDLKGYKADKKFHEAHIVQWSYLLQKVQGLSVFKQARDKAVKTLKDCMDHLIGVEVMQLVNTKEANFISKFGVMHRAPQLYITTDYDQLRSIANL